MVPAEIVILQALPLTPNGKLDRRALPAPHQAKAEETAGEDPCNELERTIAQAWRETLNTERVGIHENFFDLGGHSVLVVQVHRKLRERLGRDISIIDLFKYSTISTLAEHLSREDGQPESKFDMIQDAAKRQKEARQRRNRGR
jgi:acyl carrier protein